MITQKDIAKKLGISVMTVSRALRGQAGVSANVRDQVLAAARELGYASNPYVQGFVQIRQRRGEVSEGPVVAWLGPGFDYLNRFPEHTFAHYYEGAEVALAARGFRLESFQEMFKKSGYNANAMTRVLRSRGIDGILLGPYDGMQEIHQIDWSFFTVVQVGRSCFVPGMKRVASDHFHNMLLCVDYLQTRGFRRIGYFEHQTHNLRNEGRWEAAFRYRCPKIPPCLVETQLGLSAARLAAYVKKHRLDAVVTAHASVWDLRNAMRPSPGIAFLQEDSVTAEAPRIEVNHRLIGASAAQILMDDLYANRRGLYPQTITHSIQGVFLKPGALVQERETETIPRQPRSASRRR
ncbi:MAG: LacI family DNA-binding transcriptional regulator [Verrucomicrobia bacterium]|nr:LacI family DNA-binding transcriptional regulator [Verrucomicrobiota bacterium]MCH8513918.1 LacI family transcriptional regulator [Kiritimatiellia bacterium]